MRCCFLGYPCKPRKGQRWIQHRHHRWLQARRATVCSAFAAAISTGCLVRIPPVTGTCTDERRAPSETVVVSTGRLADTGGAFFFASGLSRRLPLYRDEGFGAGGHCRTIPVHHAFVSAAGAKNRLVARRVFGADARVDAAFVAAQPVLRSPRQAYYLSRRSVAAGASTFAVVPAAKLLPFKLINSIGLLPALWLLLFIVIDCGQALSMDWAEKRSWQSSRGRSERQYSRQTALVVESLLSVTTGLLFAGTMGGCTAVRQCFDLRLLLRFLPVAIGFATGLSLKMMSVNHFQAGTVKVFGQLRLPLAAVVSVLVFKRHYSLARWMAISMLTTSCVTFVLMKGQNREKQGRPWKWTGLLQMTGWVCLNVVGGILAESAYKDGDLPVYVQKVGQDLGHLLVSSVMLFLVVPRVTPSEDVRNPKERPGGFFDSWDFRTVSVVLFLFLDAWLGCLLLKHFSSVTRSVAKAFCVAVVYFVSFFYSKERRGNPALTLAALQVIQSSLLFGILQ